MVCRVTTAARDYIHCVSTNLQSTANVHSPKPVARPYLTRSSQCVADLCFARTKLPKYLRNGSSLYPSSKEFVQLLGASCELDNFRPPLVKLGCRGEAHRNQLGCLILYLICFSFTYSFYGNESFLRSIGHRLYCVVPSICKLLHISSTDTLCLVITSQVMRIVSLIQYL